MKCKKCEYGDLTIGEEPCKTCITEAFKKQLSPHDPYIYINFKIRDPKKDSVIWGHVV